MYELPTSFDSFDIAAPALSQPSSRLAEARRVSQPRLHRALRPILRLSVVAVLLLLGSASTLFAQVKRVSNDPTQWRAELPTLAHVRQQNFFPGVDLIFGGHQEMTTGVFVVQPGGDPDAIMLDFFEANGLTLDAQDEAQVQTDEGEVRVLGLKAYQPQADLSRGIVGRSGPDVPVAFVERSGNQIGLQVGSYDRARPLWIRFELRFPGYETLMASKTAATFIVTRTDDPAPGPCAVGDCSLREAVIAANAAPGADIITLAAGTYSLTITTGEDSGFSNAAAAGDLDINDDVTINGVSAASTIIQYASAPPPGCDCKIFGINQNGSASNIQVAINNVTIQGGDNSAPTGSFQDTGGAIDIFLVGTAANVQLSDCVVDNNKVSNATAGAYGGGINIDSGFGTVGAFKGSVSITDCAITNNTADATGGGLNLFADNHDVTITRGSVSSNTTLGTAALGASGGGINIRHSNGGSVQINGTTIDSNDAKGPGGGVAVAGSSNQSVTIQDDAGTPTVISNNTSRDGTGNEARGGGLFNTNGSNSTTLTNVTITGNHADLGSGAPRGGGIFNNTGTLTVTDCTITGNTSDEGGGISNTSASATTNVTGGSITGNMATVNGGGVHLIGGTVSLSETTITGNDATGGQGGGVFHNGGSLTMNYNRIAGNTAATTTGLRRLSGTLTDITNNWWGCNDDPDGGAGCDQVFGTSGAHNPRLVLNHAASPSSVATGGVSTLTADFLTNSASSSIAASNLDALIGLPITFDNAVLGAISSPEAVIQADGTAAATFTAGATPGAGSADATVDNGTATASITVTAPDLEVAKSNDGTPILLGATWEWRLVTTNSGNAAATYASGETILSDQLPTTNVSYGAVTVDNQTNITGTGSISCSISGGGLLTCTASGGTVIIGATTGTFRARFTATPSAIGTFTNPTGGTCSVDPNNNIAESDETDNACNSDAVVVQAPDLEVTKTNTVSGTVVLPNTWDWRMDVANTGNAAATFAGGEKIFEDTMPASGVSYAGATVSNQVGITGTGSISCSLATNVITCTASGGTVIIGATTGAFRVTTTATPSTSGAKINPNPAGGTCSVDPDGAITESDETDNTCSDTVTVTALGSITIVKVATPADDTAFGFTSDIPGGSTFTLMDPSDDTEVFASITAGSYDVTETVPAGWTLASIVCTGDTDTGSTVDLSMDKVTIDLDPGEDIICTFTNAETNLVINEVDYDQPSTDDAEFIEIKNNGTVAVDLSLVELALINGDGGGATLYDTITLPSTMLAAGDYYVVCGDAANVANCDLDTSPNTGLIQNGGVGTTNPDAVVLRRAASDAILDVVSYEGCVPGFSEGGGTCAPADPAASSPADDDRGISRFPDGTDTDSNEDDFLVKCISPGAANIALASSCTTGTIVIVKDANPADGTDFSFSTGGGLSPSTFTLDDAVPDDADSFTDTQTFASVAVGSYSVIETVPAGWSLDSATCTGGDFTAITGGVSIDLDPGETITCTFTNTEQGTITIIKDTVPDDPQDFSYTTTGGLSPSTFTLDDDADATYSNTQTFTNVSPGTFTVTEAAVAGYDASVSCTDPDGGSTTAGTNVATIDLDAGETITCTFTNTEQGTITIIKDTVPDDPQDFSYTTTGGLSPSTFTLDDDGGADATYSNTQTFTDVVPGSYSVTETLVAGYDVSIMCADPSGGTTTASNTATIDLAPGETVTCTFSNVEQGTIIIEKATDPAGGTGFGFTDDIASPNSFSLDDAGSKTFTGVAPGTYTVTEDDPTPGFDLTGLVCVDSNTGGTASTTDVVTRAATINLDAGETVTCTYTNTERGTIEIIKDTVPDDPQDFSYTTTGGLSPSTFTLDDDGGADATYSNTQTFTDVVPGSYSVTETLVAGYDVSIMCVDPSGGTTTASNTATIDLAPGETVTCTFSNVEQGTIIIEKATDPAGGTGFGFTDDIASPNSFSLDDAGSKTFTGVMPGTYTVTEDDPTPGFDLTGLVCVDSNTGGTASTTDVVTRAATINLDAGETVTCTYTNTERGTIEIIKDTVPDDPQDFAYTTTGGLSPSTFTLDDDGGADATYSNTQTFTDVVPGSYSVTETLVAGYDVSIMCVDPSGGTTTASNTATIDLAPGETVTCTFSNVEQGTIIIEKATDPAGGTGFGFTDDIASPNSFSLDDAGSKTFTGVAPGTYTVTEDDPTPGFDLTGLVCVDSNTGGTASTTDVVTRAATINLDAGETVTCTYTNTERGTIEIIKDTVPDDPQDFSYTTTGGLSPSTFTLDDDGGADATYSNTQTFTDVVPGSYSVTETLVAGYDVSIMCVDPSGGTTTASNTATIDLAPGETVTCTFSNVEQGTIIIEKATDPAGGTGFGFTDDIASPNSFSLDDAGSKTFTGVMPGTYTVTEDDPTPGFDLTGLVCVDSNTGGTASTTDVVTRAATINLDAGETVTCTYTNTERGTIEIIKDTVPDDPQDFNYTTTGGLSPATFTLDDDGGADATYSNTQTFTDVVPGSYSVTETLVAGYDVSIMCADPSGGTTTASNTATIDLAPGETVTCTFSNVEQGTIIIEKATDPAGGTGFGFTDDIASPNSFSLDDAGSKTFTGVMPGTYTVTEDDPTPGFDLTGLVCVDSNTGGTASTTDVVTRAATINLDAGETVTCTYTNTERGTIEIIKDTVPDDPQDFNYTTTGGLSPSTFTLDDDGGADATYSNTQTFTDVVPGSYSVTETLVAGYDVSIMCVDPSGGTTTASNTATIDLAPGETVTCTFSNAGVGTITIVKEATPEDDTAFDFTETITPGVFTLMDPSDDTETFAAIAVGSYDVTETVPANWTLASIVCTGDTDGGSVVDLANNKVTIDLDVGEDITCTFTNDGPPDYNATKTDALFADNDGDGLVSPGDVLAYTIEINNTGGTGTNTVFTDTPDVNTTLVVGSVTTSQGTVTTGNGGGDTMVEVDLGDVAPGSPAATITLQVTINDPFPAGVTSVSNQGALNADNDPNAPVLTDDPDTTPGSDATGTPIGGASMLEATKADALQVDNDADGQADPGDTIRYTVVLTNNGNVGAANVVFTDTPGVNTTLVAGSVTTTDGTVDTGNGGGDTDVQVSVPMIAGAGGFVTITFDVTVNSPFPATERQVSNQGAIVADNDPGTVTDDPDTPAADDPTVTPVDVKADLSLTKTASTLTPDYGSEVTFELIVRNAGPSEASAVVTDILPAGLTYVSHDGGAYDARTGAWQTDRLAVGINDSLWITARVETVFPVTNAAEVTSASLPDPDSTPADGQGDDYDAVTLTPVAADLEVEKKVIAFSSDRGDGGPGDDTVTATFLITVTNHGPSGATGVFVEDPVPAGATLDAAVPSQGGYDPATAIWTVGGLAVGASATLVVTMTATAENNLYNLAEVFADQPDQDLGNNLDGAHGQHDPDDPDRLTADVGLTKTVDNETPDPGDLITYTLRVFNSGPATTAGVEVSERLPAGLEFVSATTTSASGRCATCGYNDSLGVWIVGHLPVDSSAVINITVRVTGAGSITNTATARSHLPEPAFDPILGTDPLDDNTASATITVSTGKAIAAVREGADGTPERTELGKNYPNPFNPDTVIPFGLPEAGHVTVEVYNLVGQRVAVLLDQPMAAGRHEVMWQARNQPSGLYLVRLRAGAVQKVQRVTLVK